MKIKTKIVVGAIFIAVLSVTIFGVMSLTKGVGALEDAYFKKVGVIADLKVDKIESYFFERKADMKVVQDYFNIKTNLPIVAEFANDRENPEYLVAKEALDSQLKTFQEVYGYVDFMLTDSEGKIVYMTNEGHMNKDLDKHLPDPTEKSFTEGKKDIYF